jgi:hypothetical protein
MVGFSRVHGIRPCLTKAEATYLTVMIFTLASFKPSKKISVKRCERMGNQLTVHINNSGMVAALNLGLRRDSIVACKSNLGTPAHECINNGSHLGFERLDKMLCSISMGTVIQDLRAAAIRESSEY